MTTPTSSESFEPVPALPYADGTVISTNCVTLLVKPTATAPEHRLLSTMSAHVVNGRLEIRFVPMRLPDRREQFAMRMRRQRLQR